MDLPDVHYARAGGVSIAYQVVGDGPRDLVYAPHLTNLYSLWLGPYMRPFLDRLSAEVRLIVFNPRGTGLSDRPRNVTLEARMDDISAVLDAVGIARAPLFGVAESANVCALYAATFPDRCERLALFDPYARSVRSDAYPYGATEEEWLGYVREMREHFGERGFMTEFSKRISPRIAEDAERLEWFIWMHRIAASPTAAADFARMQMETDITDVLGSIRVPTVVLSRSRSETARFVAEHIPGAGMVELPGEGTGLYADDVAAALLSFLRDESPVEVPDTVLATVLLTDLVGSTARAAALGDRAWSALLERHHAAVRAELVRHRGAEVDAAGDGFLCRFDGPARAIACAQRIVESADRIGLEVRAGIHTGECELVGEKVAGLAVHIGARISALATAGEVLVSGTVKDLVSGSGFAFEDRGQQELKGVPGTWPVFALVASEP
jgi:class 3 adenylate cyclase